MAHQVSSQNVTRRQRVYTGNRKHGGLQIMRKNSDTRYIQTRWAKFQSEQTDCDDDDDELWIAWGNNIFGIQQNQLCWCNLSVTSVTSYKNMTKWLKIKSFCSFPVTVDKNCEWQWSAQILLVYSPVKWKHLDGANAFAIPWPSGGKVTTSVARNMRPSSTPSNSSVWMK